MYNSQGHTVHGGKCCKFRLDMSYSGSNVGLVLLESWRLKTEEFVVPGEAAGVAGASRGPGLVRGSVEDYLRYLAPLDPRAVGRLAAALELEGGLATGEYKYKYG